MAVTVSERYWESFACDLSYVYEGRNGCVLFLGQRIVVAGELVRGE